MRGWKASSAGLVLVIFSLLWTSTVADISISGKNEEKTLPPNFFEEKTSPLGSVEEKTLEGSKDGNSLEIMPVGAEDKDTIKGHESEKTKKKKEKNTQSANEPDATPVTEDLIVQPVKSNFGANDIERRPSVSFNLNAKGKTAQRRKPRRPKSILKNAETDFDDDKEESEWESEASKVPAKVGLFRRFFNALTELIKKMLPTRKKKKFEEKTQSIKEDAVVKRNTFINSVRMDKDESEVSLSKQEKVRRKLGKALAKIT